MSPYLIMPFWICKDCDYKARDKYGMERHMNRKYPCNIVGVASKEKLEVKKINKITEEDLQETPAKEIKFRMKTKVNNEKGKLEKEKD
jgi:C4-type Zn-finger protein